jgi:hypothetical protein
MLLEGPTIVVADEAHEMKNAQSQFYRAMRQIKTPRRVALTGYPLQVGAVFVASVLHAAALLQI